MTLPLHRTPWLWSGLWLCVMAAALSSRPLMPMDETRYLAVAWEMWRDGDFLVPHLNGETYSHKPPLLFWLINLGWGVFGVNEWWPRLVAPAFGLASLFLTRRLALELWPETAAAWVSSMAPLVLFGGFFWAVFTTLTMFDMILTAFALIALIGVVWAWRSLGSSGGWSGFALMGLGIGLGVLTKGPAILPHILPVALLAPVWGRHLQGGPGGPGWGRWYSGVLCAVILGAAIGLAWAVPAGMAGGEAYRDAIFWGQSAGRMVSSFAHSQPWWWYGAALPVLLLPWVLWPAAWKAARRLSRDGVLAEGGIRFCIAWFVPALLIFSAISGKQFYYLLPELPAFALVLASLLDADEEAQRSAPSGMLLPGLFAVFLSAALFALPHLPLPQLPQPWWDLVASGWGLLLAAAGAGVMAAARLPLSGRIAALAALAAVFVVSIHLAMRPVLAAVFDLKPLAIRLAEWQREGVALANYSKYHGQYNFLGRLSKPIIQVGMFHPDTVEFIKHNPGGKIIAYHDKPITQAAPVATYRFRSRLIAIWDVSVVARHPGVTER
mgnify:CR=1 FL=1